MRRDLGEGERHQAEIGSLDAVAEAEITDEQAEQAPTACRLPSMPSHGLMPKSSSSTVDV